MIGCKIYGTDVTLLYKLQDHHIVSTWLYNECGLFDITLQSEKIFSFDLFENRIVLRYHSTLDGMGHIMIEKKDFIRIELI